MATCVDKIYPLEFQLSWGDPRVTEFNKQTISFKTRFELQIANETIIYCGFTRYFKFSGAQPSKKLIVFNSFSDFESQILRCLREDKLKTKCGK